MLSYGRMPPTSGWNQGIRVECAGESCPCRQGEPVHPALLVAFAPEAAEYMRAEARCTAQWASSQRGHAAGQICGREAEHQAGDVWVCDYHLERLREWFKEDQPRIDARVAIEHMNTVYAAKMEYQRELAKDRIRIRAREAAQERELAQEQVRAEIAARAETSLVYYLQREDGAIKIGTSRTVIQRAANLARTHGPLRLMAAHGGGIAEEHALHDRFRELRMNPRKEWFQAGLELLKHIRQMRHEHELARQEKLPIVDVREIGREIRRLKQLERMEADAVAVETAA